MESLARYPYSTNNAEAFQKDESWQQAKNLAKQTADALHEIESIE